jgi:acyl carrier protein
MGIAQEIKRHIVAEFLPDVQVEQLADDYDLISSGVIDSLGLLKVINWLENHFGILVDEVEIAEHDFVSVTAIGKFVDRAGHVSEPATSAPSRRTR